MISIEQSFCPLKYGMPVVLGAKAVNLSPNISALLNEIFVPNNNGKKVLDFENEKRTQRQAAKFLDVSYQTVGNWTKTGLLKKHGHGRKFYYLLSELIEAANKGG